MFRLWVSESGNKRFVSEKVDMSGITPVEIVGRTMSSGHRLCADRSGSVKARSMKQEAQWL